MERRRSQQVTARLPRVMHLQGVRIWSHDRDRASRARWFPSRPTGAPVRCWKLPAPVALERARPLAQSTAEPQSSAAFLLRGKGRELACGDQHGEIRPQAVGRLAERAVQSIGARVRAVEVRKLRNPVLPLAMPRDLCRIAHFEHRRSFLVMPRSTHITASLCEVRCHSPELGCLRVSSYQSSPLPAFLVLRRFTVTQFSGLTPSQVKWTDGLTESSKEHVRPLTDGYELAHSKLRGGALGALSGPA
jgi:hypothetical protein